MMKKQTFGNMIATLRKEKGMTQVELAEQMGVTDKAVSKWERDLSFPDISSIPRLAEIFNMTVDELIQVKSNEKVKEKNNKISEIVNLTLKGVGVAMGIAVVILSLMNEIEINSAMSMLGIGVTCLGIVQFSKNNG